MPRKKFILIILPFVISCIYIRGGRLEYYRKGEIAYSYGPMVNMVYFCTAFYLILIFILSYRKKADLTKMQRNSIRLIMGVWTFIFIIPLLFPK